jgi:hypothetical protein
MRALPSGAVTAPREIRLKSLFVAAFWSHADAQDE